MTYIDDDPRRSGAAEALAFIDQSRARLAAASDTPSSRHLAFAAIMGGLVMTPALPMALRFMAIAAILVLIGLVVRWDRRRTGMFINGYRRGRTRRVTAAMLALVLPLYGASAWLAIDRGAVAAPIMLGLAAGAGAYAGSVLWCRVFRREMLGTAA